MPAVLLLRKKSAQPLREESSKRESALADFDYRGGNVAHHRGAAARIVTFLAAISGRKTQRECRDCVP